MDAGGFPPNLIPMLGHVGVPEDAVHNQYMIDHAGRIPYLAFKISIATLFAIAVVMVVIRVAIRLTTRRRLYLDDAFLIFGLCCLTATTIIAFIFARAIFIAEAMNHQPISVKVSVEDLLSLTDTLSFVDAFLDLCWATTFSVKFSYLALFHNLISRVSKKLTWYYWTVVGITVLTWAFLESETFILCPYFGVQSVRCLPEPPKELTLAMTILITTLDIITDCLIISIPIKLVQKSMMKTSQKMNLLLMFCLSVVMMMFALTRAAGFRFRGSLDLVYEIYFQYMEACVAVMMGSLTAYRSLFRPGEKNEPLRGSGSRTVDSWCRRLLRFTPRSRRTKPSSDRSANPSDGWVEIEQDKLPEVSPETLKTLKGFVQRNNRTQGAATMDNTNLNPLEMEDLRYLGMSSRMQLQKKQIDVNTTIQVRSSIVDNLHHSSKSERGLTPARW